MQEADNLERALVILSAIAVRLLQLRERFDERYIEIQLHNGRTRTTDTTPCTEILAPDEWKILWVCHHKTKPPTETPSIKWAYHTLAKLGGWLDTKRTGRVGWDTLWKGWDELMIVVRFQRNISHVYENSREL